jgi:FAD/FMN-containing dehydrogenase/Fe-S oxidoreductase
MDDLSASALADFQTALAAAIRGDVRFDRFSRASHATDASVYQIFPLGVVAPRSAEDVITAVNLCREHGVSITARGGGTSQAGQAIGPGISLDFSKHLNRILALDVEARTVWVEPGLVLDELNAHLRPHGLQLPLDLSTSSRATLGGMIANNSAGTRSVIYGKTIDYVESLRVVLADGSLVEMDPLAPTDWSLKAAQPNREGAAYRTVQHLAATHQDEIRQRYPRIQRRVGGYNLDEFVPGKQPFNLARILVGSEGTLGMTVAAKVRLVPLVKHRVVCSVQFADILEAMTATPFILEHSPSAVELVDRFLLDMTKGRIEFEPLRDFIQGDPGAVLIVEFMGDDPDALPGRIDRLEADLRERGLGNHSHRAIAPAAQARIWQLRQAALGLTMSATGDPKAISFVEDTAVSPEHLRDYIENFQTILARHDTQAGFYAHASVGLLHIRPVVDMKTAEGVAAFQSIAEEVAELVLEYGGALSGEHGDGLVRAPFQEKMFGPVLYEAFCQVKAAFDPTGLFNPGKIVHAPALTANLRFGPDYETPDYPTTFDFSDFGGILRAAEQCSGVGACRQTLTGTMCPSYMATRNETDSTRGRANALRVALSRGLDSIGLADEELRPVLDLCLECKACKRECPTGVDMARLKSEFLHQSHQTNGASLKERLLSRADLIGAWGSRLAPVSNWALGSSIVRRINEQIIGLDRRRPLPTFAAQPFHASFRPTAQVGEGPTVALFADTFNNFYEPAHLHAAAGLLAAAGAQVIAPPRICCGRPLISKGFLDQAKAQAEQSVAALLPLAEAGIPILFVEPSCHSAVIDDHPRLLRGQAAADAQKVADASLLVENWVARQEVGFVSGPKKILLHGHCHQKALVGMDATVQLLSLIPGCQVTALDSGCCGMAGSFGYEHYALSQAVGERRLFPAVRGMDGETVIVAPGYSCRQQIHHFTGTVAQSPVSLLRSLQVANEK